MVGDGRSSDVDDVEAKIVTEGLVTVMELVTALARGFATGVTFASLPVALFQSPKPDFRPRPRKPTKLFLPQNALAHLTTLDRFYLSRRARSSGMTMYNRPRSGYLTSSSVFTAGPSRGFP